MAAFRRFLGCVLFFFVIMQFCCAFASLSPMQFLFAFPGLAAAVRFANDRDDECPSPVADSPRDPPGGDASAFSRLARLPAFLFVFFNFGVCLLYAILWAVGLFGHTNSLFCQLVYAICGNTTCWDGCNVFSYVLWIFLVICLIVEMAGLSLAVVILCTLGTDGLCADLMNTSKLLPSLKWGGSAGIAKMFKGA